MKLLLDTHVLLWAASEPEQLGDEARDALEDGSNDVLVSIVSAWEIAIKQSLGKLGLPKPAEQWLPEVLRRTGFELCRSWACGRVARARLALAPSRPFRSPVGCAGGRGWIHRRDARWRAGRLWRAAIGSLSAQPGLRVAAVMIGGDGHSPAPKPTQPSASKGGHLRLARCVLNRDRAASWGP